MRPTGTTAMIHLQVRKVPAVISSKSKDELHLMVLDLLKKLKSKDKKIAGQTQIQLPILAVSSLPPSFL